MKFMVISDNHDTITGMRLAGIDGVLTHDVAGVHAALTKASEDETIGIVLITEKLVPQCHDLIYDYKLNKRRPLLVEIPDRHAEGRTADSITRYIREAIGIKL
ncbi:MAG: ATP synthase subunit F [Clostridiales bacterium 43-6]|nr:MAG: ATP synthase subunit F [Clostridiales bacterium 43-6]